MPFIVNQNCIKCKYTDCVEVCPVDCFHEGPNMLVIDPDECIDCTLCEPECPVDAYQKALAIDSSNSRILHNMGVVQLQESTRTFIDLKNQTQPNDPLHIRAQLVINAIANLFYKEFEIEMEN